MFNLSVVTPTQKLVSDQAMVEVFVPSYRGELNILEGHSPLLTTLTEGVLRYKLQDDGGEKAVAISWGYCEVTPTGVSIMAETAETPEQIDVARAKDALKKAESELLREDSQPEDIEKYHRKRMRAEARINVGNTK